MGYYDSMNLYQYCFNNPVNYLDPWGLEAGLGGGGTGIDFQNIPKHENSKKCKGAEKENYEPSWFEKCFWDPETPRYEQWEWIPIQTIPGSSWMSGGYVGKVEVTWVNEGYYEQYGSWKWDMSGYWRKWGARRGNKKERTFGTAVSEGASGRSTVSVPKPRVSPNPNY